jgi:hypothetical protein
MVYVGELRQIAAVGSPEDRLSQPGCRYISPIVQTSEIICWAATLTHLVV